MKTPNCPRCQSLYSVTFKVDGGRQRKHPLLLRCGHTFCETCLQKCSRSVTEDAVDCPTCQVPTKVGPGTNLHKFLNPDLYTVGLIWTRRMDLELQSQKIYGAESARSKRREVKGAQAARSGVSCNECHINTATCQCVKCDCVMCRPCFDKIHQMSNSLKKHQPLPYCAAAEERMIQHRKTRSRHCAAHEQCQIEYFCNDDNQAICSRCVIMGDHKGHNVQTMEDKNKECLSEMEPAILAAQETVWRLDRSEKLISEAVPSARFDSKGLVEEVQLHFQELHSMLQAREEQLLDDIKEASLNGAKPIHEMKSYLQDEKLNLEMALVDAARAMQGSIHRLVDADLVLERLRKAKDVACMVTVKNAVASPVRFSYDTSFKDIIGSYGEIAATNPNQMFTLSLPGPDAEKPPPEELRNYLASDLDTLSTTDTESVTDSVSAIVDEEKEYMENTEDFVAAEVVNTEPASYPPSKRLVVGHSEKVCVTHIRTPAQFYVQLGSRQGELDTMCRQINQHCRSQQFRRDLPECVDVGNLLLAQFSHDKVWYRARVTSIIEPDENEAEGKLLYDVFFIDYGNSETVTKQKMRKMKKKFESYPAFAYECSLYDILPVDETEGWAPESVATMLQMTSSGPMIMMVVNSLGGVLEVDLSKPEDELLCADDRPVSVRDSLVFLEMAIFNTRSSTQSGAPRMKRDYVTLPRVWEGTVVDIGINCVHSPSRFYAQMLSDQSREYLQRLLLAVQEVYSKETQHLYTIFCPRKDMICMARYAKDNNWYRGRITGLPGHRKVEVQFVDYGNVEIIDHSDVCKILDDHIKYPMQALECSLADVEPLENGQWSNEAKAWFRSLAELQLCQMRVTVDSRKANSLVGVLYAIDGDNRLCCVNYELVRRRFARSTGPWSEDASFLGITLKPEALQDLSGASSSSAMSVSTLSRGSHHPNSSFLSPSSGSNGKAAASPGKHRKTKASPCKPRGSPKAGHPCKPRGSPKAGQSPSPSLKSAARRKIAMENVEQGWERPVPAKRAEEEAAEATCSPGQGAVVVLISGYQSPAHFYIQLQEKQEELLNLMVELASYETASPSSRVWAEGDFCVAKYSQDDRWYRGKIEKQAEDNVFEVHLVDFGHTDTVPASRLQPLKKSHGTAECFAERCHLADLLPAGSSDRTKWSNTAKEFVLNQVHGKRLFVKLEGERVPDLGLPVDILIEETIPETAFDPPRHEYVSLVTLIQDKGLAIPMKKRKSSDPPTDPGAATKADTFCTKLIATSPEHSASQSWDVKGEEEGKVGEDAPESSSTKEPVVIVQLDLEVAPHQPPTSTTLSVLPVYVDDEGVIYAHDMDEEEKCNALGDQLEEYAQKEAPEGQLKVKVGQVCLAHFDTDNAWYRARVLETSQSNVKVKYVDYGNSSRVERSKLKLITPELCATPQLAYEFKLHNVKPDTVDGSWPVSFLEYMHNQIVNCQCTAEIKGSADGHPVEVDLLLSDSTSISNMLLDIGVLVKENDMEEFYQRSSDITNILNHSNPYFPLRLGDKGDSIHGLVTHIELPNLVYMQRCAASPEGDLPADVLEFDRLMEDLNNLPVQTPMLEEVPAAGEMCSARYSQDNRWYRALVAKAFPTNSTALIFYVDYGNSEVVPLDRLRVLPQKFQDTPAQALRAYLSVDLPDDTKRWTLHTYQAMAEAVFLRRHLVLIKHTEPLTVELFSDDNPTEGAPILSYQQLIDNGLVVLPRLSVVSTSDEDNVIVESESEVEEDVSSPMQE